MRLVKNIFDILILKERRKLVQLVLLDVLISLLDISFLAGLLLVVQFYTDAAHSRLFLWFPHLLGRYPLSLIALFFILFSIKNLFGFLVFKMQSSFTYSVASRLSKKNLDSYLNGSFSNYINTDSSLYIRKISQQPIEFCYYLLGGLQQIISQLILILITIITILLFNPFLFPILFAILTPPVILAGLFQKKRLKKIREKARNVRKETIQHLQEALSGFVESNLYQRKGFFAKRYQNAQEQFNNFLSTQQVVQNLPSRLIEVFAVFGLFVLILISSAAPGNNSIQLITLGAFMAAAYKIIPGIVKIINIVGQMKTYDYTVADLNNEKNPGETSSSHDQNAISRIVFDKISFQYLDKKLLDTISFVIEPGDFVGVSGISGRGKTTLIHLMLGFLKSSSGFVYINGVKMEDIDREQYWKKISYIKQQPFFIHDTAVKNVVLSDEGYDEERFDFATGVSGFKTFINGDASKIIRENGKNISGGQRQRISFARALYKNFDLLILDEPFSEMDEASERRMLEQLKILASQGKMIFLVTHNRSGLEYCSKIISLEDEG